MEGEGDAKIIEACLSGDGRAYAGLVRRYGKRVYAICLAMTGSAADAEDMMQETFMRGFTELGSLRERDRFGPWIASIAGNLSRNFLKKRARGERIAAAAVDCTREDRADLSDLGEVLMRLPEQHRMSLMLYYFDARSAEAVAAVLGISIGAVHTRLSRARSELRKLLEKAGGAQ